MTGAGREGQGPMNDRFYEEETEGRRIAPAVARNCGPIGDVLAQWLPQTGVVLELASGTGEHALAFARRFPRLEWQPSDISPAALASIKAWQDTSSPANLRPPIIVDASNPRWPLTSADAVVSINMVHISPWASALGLIEGAAAILEPGASLILYGPWLEKGVQPAPSNLAFDADLRRRDPSWGLRMVDAFTDSAAPFFELEQRRSMPAHNLMLLFRKRRAASQIVGRT